MGLIFYNHLVLLTILIGLLVAPAIAATTQIHVVKYANDGTTILSETTKTFQWLEANLPVLGDGTTPYSHQGPVFLDDPANEDHEQELRLNPEENVNIQDQGAVKGTNLKDICNLVGGMNAGETLKLKASDGLTRKFAYENVYEYPSQQGPMVVTWYWNGNYVNGSYSSGMKLVFFADDYIMGNYDWHESSDSQYWYYYVDGSEKYPTTTGLSVKYISDVLIYSDDAPPIAPVAVFSADPVSGDAPLTVLFSEASTGTGPLTYAWDFTNDGTVDSTEKNPSHIYDTAGTYTVNLTVTNHAGSDTEIKTDYITVSTPLVPPTAAFTSDIQSGIVPLTVRFTDQSTGTGPFTYSWDFNNDGTADSTEQNPSHVYDTAGIYAVKFTVTGPGGLDDEIKTDYITVSPAPVVPSAGFTATPTYLSVVFTDTSTGTGPLTYAWDFGDGGSSIDQNPVHVYTSAGTYTVKLTVTGPGGVDDETISVTVAAAPVAPVAAYTATPTYLSVVFTDASTGTGPLTYAWDFGDGGSSTDQSPIHVYAAAGTYNVKLTVTGPGGTDDETKSLTITAAPVVDIIYDGTVTLTRGETLIVHAYNNITGIYTVSRTTPLGALDRVASLQGFTYNVTDKRWLDDEVLMLDDLGQYLFKKPNVWYAYVNGVYKDGYGNHANGLNVIELADNDQVAFYYAPNKNPNPVLNATAVVRITVDIQEPGPVVDTIFDGTVTLTPDETFTIQAYNNATGIYTVGRTTPLGALDKVASQQGFTYNVTDKRWIADVDVLLLDDISHYLYKKPNVWYAYVNGVYKDGYGNLPDALNVIELADNDQVDFYYAPNKNPNPVLNATAVIKIKVDIGGSEPAPDWTLELKGAKSTSITRTLFEEGLACPASGHQEFWTDTDGNVWGVYRSGCWSRWSMIIRISDPTISTSMTALQQRDIQ